MTLKIKTKVLNGFLKKIMMQGPQGIDEGILMFGKEGLKFDANSPAKQVRVMSWLQKLAFKEYEQLGNVGVNDMSTIVKVLDRFGEFVAFSKKGNLLTIKGDSKKVDVELVAESFLATDTGEPDLKEFKDTFGITATKLKEYFKDVQLNKDATLTFETIEKKVKITNTGKYKFLNELEALTCKGGAKTTFGDPFIDATSMLDGNLEISIGVNYPAKVMEKTDNSTITLIIAPRVEEE